MLKIIKAKTRTYLCKEESFVSITQNLIKFHDLILDTTVRVCSHEIESIIDFGKDSNGIFILNNNIFDFLFENTNLYFRKNQKKFNYPGFTNKDFFEFVIDSNIVRDSEKVVFYLYKEKTNDFFNSLYLAVVTSNNKEEKEENMIAKIMQEEKNGEIIVYDYGLMQKNLSTKQ